MRINFLHVRALISKINERIRGLAFTIADVVLKEYILTYFHGDIDYCRCRMIAERR